MIRLFGAYSYNMLTVWAFSSCIRCLLFVACDIYDGICECEKGCTGVDCSTGPDVVKYIVNHVDLQAVFCEPKTLNTVRMVTGDNLQTAKAIALECGILQSGADATLLNIIEGKTFRDTLKQKD